jgi:hypothetical protein
MCKNSIGTFSFFDYNHSLQIEVHTCHVTTVLLYQFLWWNLFSFRIPSDSIYTKVFSAVESKCNRVYTIFLTQSEIQLLPVIFIVFMYQVMRCFYSVCLGSVPEQSVCYLWQITVSTIRPGFSQSTSVFLCLPL